MSKLQPQATAVFILLVAFATVAHAKKGGNCPDHRLPEITFIEYTSFDNNPFNNLPPPGIPDDTEITVKGKLKIPTRCNAKRRGRGPKAGLPAVLILHGSAGVDSRGDFYARALNAAGIATLEIDYWEARGVSGVGDRPPLPIVTYPDAFGGLAFLSQHEQIDPARIGVLGFSWGGVMSLAAAEQTYAGLFGQGLQFAAHAAHYPVCYGANNDEILDFFPFEVDPLQAGTQFLDLTGAPVLIQIGTQDDYDGTEDDLGNGADPCLLLAEPKPAGPLSGDDAALLEVEVYEGAYHAWDRLQVPVSVRDPFGDRGSFLLGDSPIPPIVEIVPDVDQAYESRREVVRFFKHTL